MAACQACSKFICITNYHMQWFTDAQQQQLLSVQTKGGFHTLPVFVLLTQNPDRCSVLGALGWRMQIRPIMGRWIGDIFSSRAKVLYRIHLLLMATVKEAAFYIIFQDYLVTMVTCMLISRGEWGFSCTHRGLLCSCLSVYLH